MSTVRKVGSTVNRISIDDLIGLIEFLLSDASIDAYGDVIDPHGWVLDEFRANPIALVNHDPNFPCGTWHNVRVERGALRGDLKLAPAGTSPRIDEIRKLVEAGIMRSCSVGFVPLEAEPIPGSKQNGIRYKKSLLRECSIVAIPANPNALAQKAKAIGISDATIRSALGQSPNATLAERQARAKAQLEYAEMKLREIGMSVAELKANVARRKKEARKAKLIAEAEARLKAKRAEDDVLEGLTPAQQAIVKQALLEDQYAIPFRNNKWDQARPVELFFNGKPMYRKKGPFGW